MVKYLDNNSGFSTWNANNQNKVRGARSRLSSFLWWVVLFLGSWWLLSMWTAPKQTVAPDAVDVQAVETNVYSGAMRDISSDKISAKVGGLRVSDIVLADFGQTSNPADGNVKLLNGETGFVEVGLVATGTTAPDAKTVWNMSGDKMTWHNSDGVVFARDITVDGYLITITDTIENKTKHSIGFAPYVKMVRPAVRESSAVETGAVANVNSSVQYVDWHKMDKKSYAYSTTNGFVGFADQYWETVADTNANDKTIRMKSVGDKYVADSTSAQKTIDAGATGIFTTTIFAGPRDQEILDSAATTISGINSTVDYGWFWFFARPILWLLNIINSWVLNYGIAIIIMTIFLRLLMWPLTRKSYTSTLAMQKMQPELARIQKLYANDKMRLQMEMMKLYKTHKTSPMSGCLPMLLQIPIFFALYKALLVSVQMRSAHFLWISDLAAMDPYFILPILMGATMWLQQYLQTGKTKDADKNNVAAQTGRIMKWMPLIFTVMFAWMPAGLVLYWTVSNIFGIFQMMIIKKNLNKK